jgi:hypothetical protein
MDLNMQMPLSVLKVLCKVVESKVPVVVVKKAVTGNEADSKDIPSPRGWRNVEKRPTLTFFFFGALRPPPIDLPNNRVYFFHGYVLRDFLLLIST